MIRLFIWLALAFRRFWDTPAGATTSSWAELTEWRNAVHGRGLRELEAVSFPRDHLIVESALLRITFTAVAGPDETLCSRIAFTPRSGPGHLMLRPETFWTAVDKNRGAREIETGDLAFDDAFFVGGVTTRVRALLDDQTRRALLSLTSDGLIVVDRGELRAVLTPEAGRALRSTFARLFEVATRLCAEPALPERLASNVRQDSKAGVRVQSILCLAREFRGHPVAEEALRAALEDMVPEVRLEAAIALRDEGRATLERLATDPAVADACAARAVAALGRRLPPERLLHILRPALRLRRVETAEACVKALATAGAPDPTVLIRVLAIERGRLAAAAASALATLRATGGEEPLIEALERDPEPEARLAMVEALARLGGSASVMPLQETARRHEEEEPLQRAVRQAIAEIHARAASASPGQLSLAADEAGRVSLAPQSGRVSLADGETGRLSLPGEPPRHP